MNGVNVQRLAEVEQEHDEFNAQYTRQMALIHQLQTKLALAIVPGMWSPVRTENVLSG